MEQHDGPGNAVELLVICKHRWLIESPNGTPLVRGECRRCGATRMFPASNDAIWNTQAFHARIKAYKAMKLTRRDAERQVR